MPRNVLNCKVLLLIRANPCKNRGHETIKNTSGRQQRELLRSELIQITNLKHAAALGHLSAGVKIMVFQGRLIGITLGGESI